MEAEGARVDEDLPDGRPEGRHEDDRGEVVQVESNLQELGGRDEGVRGAEEGCRVRDYREDEEEQQGREEEGQVYAFFSGCALVRRL